MSASAVIATVPTRRSGPSRVSLLAAACLLAMLPLFCDVSPTEAAFRRWQPVVTCAEIPFGRGSIQIHPGIFASGRRAEDFVVGYVVQRWNGRRWRKLTEGNYVSTAQPVGATVVTFPPVAATVKRGYYRVWVVLVWYEGGRIRNWAGWAARYTDEIRSRRAWCKIRG